MPATRIDDIFATLRSEKRKGLMPFVCGASPKLGDTTATLLALQKAGASVVEVGYPFSDPIADGPVIAAAMHEALKLGATPERVNAEIGAARKAGLLIGVVAMVSVSIVHRVGMVRFFSELASNGVDGVILPDVSVEEAIQGGWVQVARASGLSVSLLVAPTTGPERAKQIAAACSGFVYVLARAGVTGGAGTGHQAPGTSEGPDTGAGSLGDRVRMLRRVTDLPLAVGFGISTAQDVRRVVVEAGADAAIVGSALVKRMTAASDAGRDVASEAEVFARELAAGLR